MSLEHALFEVMSEISFSISILGQDAFHAKGNSPGGCVSELDVSAEDLRVQKLIAEAVRGDRSAFSELAEHYLPLLSREAAKFVAPSDIEDIVQEALIRMFRAIPSYQERGRFEYWARRIVSRAALDYWRATRKRGRLASALALENDEEIRDGNLAGGSLRAIGLRGDLERCLQSLSPEDRMVCIMAFLEERSHREIADMLNSTTVAIKVRCFRLRNKLKLWFTL